MIEQPRRFAVCIHNQGHEESLELRKIYEVLTDSAGEKHGMFRVIDEEGEDYLYPSRWFISIELPRNLEDAIVDLVHQ